MFLVFYSMTLAPSLYSPQPSISLIGINSGDSRGRREIGSERLGVAIVFTGIYECGLWQELGCGPQPYWDPK